MASSLGSIQFGGLASGLPSDIVDQMMKVEELRMTRLEQDQSYYTNQKSAFSELSTKLKSLSSLVEGYQDTSSFSPHTATSSDEDTIEVTASSSAIAGFHSVKVSQLATYSQVVFGDGGTDGSSPGTGVASGATLTADSTMGFTYNDTDYSVNVSSGDSLEDIASAINSVDYGDEEGITASVLYDGSTYRLVMTANDSGAYSQTSGTTDANSGERVRSDNITLSTDLTFDDGTTIGTGDFFHTEVGSDAVMTVDGLSNIYSSSNTVSDIIPGVTMTLKNTTSGSETVSMTIADDSTTLKETVNTFISSYNEVVSYVNSKKSGEFSAETSVRSIISMMRRELNTETNVTGSYASLAAIGVETDQYTGKLSLDEDVFNDAIAEDFDAVSEIFATDDSSSNTGLAYRLEDLMDEITASSGSILSGKTKSLDYRLDALDDRIEREEVRLEAVRVRLTMKFANMEQLISSMNAQGNALTSALSGL
jgi:flagellar hook-associated protein 2